MVRHNLRILESYFKRLKKIAKIFNYFTQIRQRMQIQINNLQENFELVEIRLRTLQGQVTSLKTSYTVMLSDEEDSGDFNKIATS